MLIHIQSEIPAYLQFNADALTDYLWEVMVQHVLLTLNSLWYVCPETDYRTIDQFYDCNEAATVPDRNTKGCVLFAKQVCIMDVARILKEHPDACMPKLRREPVVTTLHELRHLVFYTNPSYP